MALSYKGQLQNMKLKIFEKKKQLKWCVKQLNDNKIKLVFFWIPFRYLSVF